MGKIYNWKILNENIISNKKDLLQSLLENRGIDLDDEQTRFLNCDYTLGNPLLIRGMTKAVDRIKDAKIKKEKVLVYGDYDCDGITATTIIVKTLRKLGINTEFFIPNRFEHGYGPNEKVFKKIISSNYNLVIAVDNGITGIVEAKLLKDNHIDYIIIDHHEPQDELPEAFAIINPKVDGETYEFKEFCGAGLALKLAQALLGNLSNELLEIAAIGTLADMVPLVDENRYIVSKGLNLLANSENSAIRKIVVSSKNKNIDSDFIGFQISPLINTVGRVDDAQKAVMFLLEDDEEIVTKYFSWIKNLNGQRKKRTNDIFQQAKELVIEQNEADSSLIMVYSDLFHQGLVGIVANRLMDYCNKPTFVFFHNKETDILVGSGRSQKGFNLFENVSGYKEYLEHFGGHAYAMGASIKANNFRDFKNAIENLAKTKKVQFFLDIEIKIPLELCNVDTLEEINKLEPFGQQNKKPVLLYEGLTVKNISKIGDGSHLKIRVSELPNVSILAFGLAEKMKDVKIDSIIDVVGIMQKNSYDQSIDIVLSDFDFYNS